MIKPIVLHYHRRFFARTETFIYHYIKYLENFSPLLYAKRYINLNQFPVTEEMMLCPKESDFSLLNSIHRIVLEATTVNLFLPKLLKKYQIQLIHAHFGPQGYAALKLKSRCNAPLCTTFYGYDVSQRARDKRWLKLFQELFRQGDLFLTEGEFMRNSLVKLGCPESKIRIQRIALPLDLIRYRRRVPKRRGEKVNIFFAGSFVEKKGLIYALEAIDMVRKKNPNVHFNIIGDGPLRGILMRFIRENSLTGIVDLYGFLPYNAYLKTMEDADIFLHPSVTAEDGDSEGGAPTVILEAQAMGLPIVSTYHADIPNIVVDGKSALLSQERNAKALAESILTLMEDQGRWVSMGEEGREFVCAQHDIKKQVILLEKKYEELMGRNPVTEK